MKKNESDVLFSLEHRKLLPRLKIVLVFLFLSIGSAYGGNPSLIGPPAADRKSPGNEDFQQKTISGTVTDETGQPLPGVNVTVKGTTTGSITDMKGKFQLTLPAGAKTLVFSFIGLRTQEVEIGTQNSYNIKMSQELVGMEEVVVVGYGVQKKESVVGAISQVQGDIVKQTAQGADLSNALTGTLPGMAVVRTGGLPGGKDYGTTEGADDDFSYMYIRGQKTWNSSQPLVLVDGVERPLYNLDPNEIDKISLLKDASATAVFGVKGANGVILVTTKRGSIGRPMLTFNSQVSAKTISRVPHRLGAYDANVMRNYAILNEVPYNANSWNYIVPERYLQLWKDHTYPEYLADVDWVNEFTKDWGWNQQYNLSVQGGTKVVKYFGSLAYDHEGDIINITDIGQGYSPNFLFDRFNFRTNLDFDITPTTRFSTNLNGYYLQQKRPDGNKWSGWFGLWSRPPDLYPVRYSDGTWADYSAYSRYQNSLYLFDMFGYQLNKETQLTTDFRLDQKLDFITKGLSASGKLAYDNTFVTAGPRLTGYGTITKYIKQEIVDHLKPGMTEDQIKAFEAEHTVWANPGTTGDRASSGFDWRQPADAFSSESATNASVYRKLYYELSINYTRDFDKHTIGGLLLFSRQEEATGSNFMSYREDWVGRATYSYDKKYLFELNGAYNGSEKFSNKNRFGFFPAVALGWVPSNEAFYEPIKPYVSTLKFRYSDGKIGSDAGIARWLYIGDWIVKQNVLPTASDYNSSQNVYRFGAPWIQNAYPLRYQGVIPNPDIKWETTHKRDLGIETGFFKDVFRINLDLWSEDRTNIFVTGSDIPVPDYFGAPPVSQNLGHVKAHGFELELNFNKTTAGGFNYWLSHMWSFAKDKIITRADPPLMPWYQKQAGYQIGQPRVTLNQDIHPMLTWNDIYNTVGSSNNAQLLPGDFAPLDFNSDGILDSNDNIPYGYPTRPQYEYSTSVGASWKNLSGNVRFYGVYNVEGSIGVYRGAFSDQFNTVYPWNRMFAWSPEFDNTESAINPGLRFVTGSRSGYIEQPRSYIRLQHAELAYILSSPYIKKIGVTNLRVIVSGDNIALWTKSRTFDDFDAPQITSEGNVRRSYPVLKSWNLGLSFNFQ